MQNTHELIYLFISAFFAATIFPAQSELFLFALKSNSELSTYILVTVATIGNVMGAIVNWLLGYYLIKFKDKKWFPVTEKKLTKSRNLYTRYGLWTLLFSWLPIIGDPLTVVAGIFRLNIYKFITLVTIGKLSRYLVVAYLI